MIVLAKMHKDTRECVIFHGVDVDGNQVSVHVIADKETAYKASTCAAMAGGFPECLICFEPCKTLSEGKDKIAGILIYETKSATFLPLDDRHDGTMSYAHMPGVIHG